MYLLKCDLCDHLQEGNERFFHIAEITKGDRSKINIDFCIYCYNTSFKNLKGDSNGTDS